MNWTYEGSFLDIGFVAMPTRLQTTTSEPTRIMMMSLLDIAVKKCGEEPLISDKRTLVFAGSKSVGKTTMTQRFLEKNEPIKETLALEYSFGRKSGRSLTKDVCHIWELGGGTLFSNLLQTTLALGSDINETTIILVVDLSAPRTLWLTVEIILQTVYNHMRKYSDSDPTRVADERIPEIHEDRGLISPFPLPLVIIGAKYDQYVSLDPEEQKLIARTLRLVAHSTAASLLFYSDKDASTVKKLKDILNHHGFGGTPWKGLNIEANKPLSISCGSDSFQEIGLNSSSIRSSVGLGLDRFKHTFTGHFLQDSNEIAVPDDPAKDANFREPIVDALRNERDEELDRILSEMENRKKIIDT